MASILTNLWMSLTGMGMSVRADADTIAWMVANAWKKKYHDGWLTGKDGTRIQVVIDGSIPECELHLFDHHGDCWRAFVVEKMRRALSREVTR